METQPQESLWTKAKNWVLSVPLFVKTVFFVCIVVYLSNLIFDVPSVLSFAFNYFWVTRKFQLWRLFSYTIMHLGLLHIAFNMMSLMTIGWALEVRLGSLHLLITTLVLILMNSSINMLTSAIFIDLIQLNESTVALNVIVGFIFAPSGFHVGYSGVLFAYMVFTTSFGPVQQSLFGIWNVPAKIYPWILLVITSVIFPGVSFIGHLCGVISGYIFVYLILNFRPYNAMVKRIDQMIPSKITSMSSYYPSIAPEPQQEQSSERTRSERTVDFDTVEEADQMQEMRQQEQGSVPSAIKKGYLAVKQSIVRLYHKLRGTPAQEVSSGEYWSSRSDGRVLGSQV
ncbi:hypothetical protein AKO1_015191 [Acrasis kona]|uniref:Peptidase S54 rhomboid domain-containing protein n=1 Tax=Acrasis kona TaxID=1008807 RepID=A0AAW2ZFG5_9EUKA